MYNPDSLFPSTSCCVGSSFRDGIDMTFIVYSHHWSQEKGLEASRIVKILILSYYHFLDLEGVFFFLLKDSKLQGGKNQLRTKLFKSKVTEFLLEKISVHMSKLIIVSLMLSTYLMDGCMQNSKFYTVNKQIIN